MNAEGNKLQTRRKGMVGLPSFLWASLKTAGLFRGRDYYSFYTEKWADKLAGIER